jgi:acetyl esterase/lipase
MTDYYPRSYPHLLALCLLGLVAPTVARGEGNTLRTYEVASVKKVAYYDGPGADRVKHKCDVFYPLGAENCPVVVLVHGGVWMIGDKSCMGLYSAVGKFLACNGIVAVLPNYRLTPWVKHPEHVKDVARAIAWTQRNCGKYGGRADQLFLAGHSAGGHLVALAATDETYLKAEGLKRSDIKGVMALSGVYRIPELNVRIDFKPEGEKSGVIAKVAPMSDLSINLPLLTMMNGAKTSFDWSVKPFGLIFGDDPEVRKKASPIEHVERGLPPFLVLYAEHELPTLAEMAEDFSKALKAKEVPAKVSKILRRNHHNILFQATTLDDPVAGEMLDFIRKYAR